MLTEEQITHNRRVRYLQKIQDPNNKYYNPVLAAKLWPKSKPPKITKTPVLPSRPFVRPIYETPPEPKSVRISETDKELISELYKLAAYANKYDNRPSIGHPLFKTFCEIYCLSTKQHINFRNTLNTLQPEWFVKKLSKFEQLVELAILNGNKPLSKFEKDTDMLVEYDDPLYPELHNVLKPTHITHHQVRNLIKQIKPNWLD